MDAKTVKARLAGQWASAIASLCRVDARILDGEHHPCPKCGGDDRFNLSREGTGGAHCNHCQPGTGDGIKTIEWLNGWEFSRTMRELEAYLDPPAPISNEVRELRHKIYSQLESIFPLDAKHKANLTDRGLTDLEIQHRGYWSAPQSAAMGLIAHFTADRPAISKAVPGVMPGGSLTLAASNALMIPVRNADGEIIGLQYRPDHRGPKTPKYLWLSSKDQGISPGSPCHFALAPAEREFQPGVVRLTEGPLKADIATALSGVRTLAIAGTGACKVGVAGVKSLSPSAVCLAFDSDAFSNVGVARAVVDCFDDLTAAGLTVHFEAWDQSHKGIDDALAAGVPTTVQSIDETKRTIESLRKVASQKQDPGKLKNFKLVPSSSENPNKAWDKKPLPANQIAEQLVKITGGWPKSCNGELFVQTKAGEIRKLPNSNALFGWISNTAPAEFSSGEGLVTKKELFEELPNHVEQYRDMEEWPHFPPTENCYYSRSFEPAEGKHLEQFLDFFCPATAYDRQLIIAFIATTFWGGAPGRRVAFGIDSISGTGAGKSELAKRVAGLTGGYYEFDAAEIKEENIRKALMNGQRHRVALLDNIKESCISSTTIESLITSATVGGHRLNIGYGSRPNNLTWVMTMNGMSMSRDLAQRTVVIKLAEPTRSGTWDDEVDKFLEEHRADVVSDVAGFFQRPSVELDRFTRWSSWERAILARLDNPKVLQTLIDNRAAEADADKTTAKSVIDYFEAQIKNFGLDTEKDVVHIPAAMATEWLIEANGQEFSKRSAAATLKNLIDGGSLKKISANPCRTNGRGWLWNPGRIVENVKYDLADFLKNKKSSDPFL